MLNKGLQHFEPIYVLPFEKVSLLINNLLWGGILLRELDNTSSEQMAGFLLGTTFWIIGVMYFLLKKDQSSQMQDFLQEEFAEYNNSDPNNCSFEADKESSATYDTEDTSK